jgi:hypothetical protein
MTTYRQGGTHGPVKSGAGQDQAGCSRTGQAGNGAPRHHRPPDNPVADIGGLASPDFQANPQPPAPMSDSSRQTTPAWKALEESDICPNAVVMPFLRPDGSLVFRRFPCKTRACEVCGPRLRAQWAVEWGHAMSGDRVNRLVVAEGEWTRMRRWKSMRGQQYATIPIIGGQRVIYTTADLGERVADLAHQLACDFTIMVIEGRNKTMSKGWLAVIADAKAEAEAKRQPLGECLGRVRRSLEQVAMVAQDLGLFLGWDGPDGLLVADPGDQRDRFWSLVGLVHGRRRKAVAA